VIAPRLALAVTLLGLSVAPGLAASLSPPPGASSCSGCHARNAGVDSPIPRLVRREADELFAAITAFKTGRRPSTVMERIAKGFTDEEIRAIADWYAEQK